MKKRIALGGVYNNYAFYEVPEKLKFEVPMPSMLPTSQFNWARTPCKWHPDRICGCFRLDELETIEDVSERLKYSPDDVCSDMPNLGRSTYKLPLIHLDAILPRFFAFPLDYEIACGNVQAIRRLILAQEHTKHECWHGPVAREQLVLIVNDLIKEYVDPKLDVYFPRALQLVIKGFVWPPWNESNIEDVFFAPES